MQLLLARNQSSKMFRHTVLNLACGSLLVVQMFILAPILLVLCRQYTHSHFRPTTSTEKFLTLIITCTTIFSFVIANPYLSWAQVIQFDDLNPHQNSFQWFPLLFSECPFWIVVIVCTLKSWMYYFDHKLTYAEDSALWATQIDPLYKTHNFWIKNTETFGNLLWLTKRVILPLTILILSILVLCGNLLGTYIYICHTTRTTNDETQLVLPNIVIEKKGGNSRVRSLLPKKEQHPKAENRQFDASSFSQQGTVP